MKLTTLKYVIVALLCAGSLYALPLEVEADSLSLEAMTAIQSKNYALAAQSLEKLGKLNVPLKETYEYHYGVALQGLGKYGKAMNMFEVYLNKGNGTKFYKEALQNYNFCKNEYASRMNNYQKALNIYNEKRSKWLKKSEREDKCYLEFQDCIARYVKPLTDAFWTDWNQVSSRRESCADSQKWCMNGYDIEMPYEPSKPE